MPPYAVAAAAPDLVLLAAAGAERLRASLERAGFAVVGETPEPAKALGAALRARPQACLVDLDTAGGLAAVVGLRARLPELAIVVMAGSGTDPDVLPALAAGAAACVLRGAGTARVVAALAAALDGYAIVPRAVAGSLSRQAATRASWQKRHALTDREAEVLEGVRAGASTAAIAAALGLSPVTVRRHVSRIVRKLRVTDRTALVRASASEAPLTERELEVLRLVATGLDNTAIAAELVITRSTVKNHLTRISAKLGARNRTHAAVLAERRNVL